MRMVLCAVLQQLDFRFAEGYDPSDWDKEASDYFAMEVGQLPAIITPRVSVTK